MGTLVPPVSIQSWRGRFYEDFQVGDVYEHALGRTITTADNIWFSLLTQNTAPVHFDHVFLRPTITLDGVDVMVDGKLTEAARPGQG